MQEAPTTRQPRGRLGGFFLRPWKERVLCVCVCVCARVCVSGPSLSPSFLGPAFPLGAPHPSLPLDAPHPTPPSPPACTPPRPSALGAPPPPCDVSPVCRPCWVCLGKGERRNLYTSSSACGTQCQLIPCASRFPFLSPRDTCSRTSSTRDADVNCTRHACVKRFSHG